MAASADESMSDSLPVFEPDIEAMLKAGVHIGHSISRKHPAMAPFVWGVRNNIEMIDLTKTKEKLEAALAFLKQAAQEGKLILFVGTRPSAGELVRTVAEELGLPWVNGRWIGGTLTNLKVVLKRIETLEKLEQDKATGEFEKYTKKESLKKGEEIARLIKNFDGLRRMKKMPDVVVIIDPAEDATAVREAVKTNIPIVAIADTNTDPRVAQFPIPANNDARPAVAYMLNRMKEAILDGRREGESLAAAAPAIKTETSPITADPGND